MINLSQFNSIQSNLFVKISSTSPILACDRIGTIELNGDTYTGVGNLLGITNSTNELRVSNNDVTITLSGIPDSQIQNVLNSKIKGSEVQIIRALFSSDLGIFLSIPGNPLIKFRGFVNNVSFDEEWNNETLSSSNTLILTCNSIISVLENKVSGRRTNPSSQRQFFPADQSMDRVPSLMNSAFDFGEKK